MISPGARTVFAFAWRIYDCAVKHRCLPRSPSSENMSSFTSHSQHPPVHQYAYPLRLFSAFFCLAPFLCRCISVPCITVVSPYWHTRLTFPVPASPPTLCLTDFLPSCLLFAAAAAAAPVRTPMRFGKARARVGALLLLVVALPLAIKQGGHLRPRKRGRHHAKKKWSSCKRYQLCCALVVRLQVEVHL